MRVRRGYASGREPEGGRPRSRLARTCGRDESGSSARNIAFWAFGSASPVAASALIVLELRLQLESVLDWTLDGEEREERRIHPRLGPNPPSIKAESTLDWGRIHPRLGPNPASASGDARGL
eukprot:1180076-Prorocentrum_minimum.AAC.3